VLGACPDFKKEIGALQELLEKRGHILLMSPKVCEANGTVLNWQYHPEIAGVGIEYCWGQAKSKFRREINDKIPKHHHSNVRKALSSDVLSLNYVRKAARRARDYMRAYSDPSKPTDYKAIEAMKKTYKSHRCIRLSDLPK